MKKTLLVLASLLVSVGAQAQFGKKLLKKGNVDAAKKMAKAATLSDDDMAKLSLESVEWMDNNNPIAEAGDPYGDRLSKLVAGLESEDGLDLKVMRSAM